MWAAVHRPRPHSLQHQQTMTGVATAVGPVAGSHVQDRRRVRSDAAASGRGSAKSARPRRERPSTGLGSDASGHMGRSRPHSTSRGKPTSTGGPHPAGCLFASRTVVAATSLVLGATRAPTFGAGIHAVAKRGQMTGGRWNRSITKDSFSRKNAYTPGSSAAGKDELPPRSGPVLYPGQRASLAACVVGGDATYMPRFRCNCEWTTVAVTCD